MNYMIFVASATDICDEAKLCHVEIFDIKCKNVLNIFEKIVHILEKMYIHLVWRKIEPKMLSVKKKTNIM